jgi:hypothetical protein
VLAVVEEKRRAGIGDWKMDNAHKQKKDKIDPYNSKKAGCGEYQK